MRSHSTAQDEILIFCASSTTTKYNKHLTWLSLLLNIILFLYYGKIHKNENIYLLLYFKKSMCGLWDSHTCTLLYCFTVCYIFKQKTDDGNNSVVLVVVPGPPVSILWPAIWPQPCKLVAQRKWKILAIILPLFRQNSGKKTHDLDTGQTDLD